MVYANKLSLLTNLFIVWSFLLGTESDSELSQFKGKKT